MNLVNEIKMVRLNGWNKWQLVVGWTRQLTNSTNKSQQSTKGQEVASLEWLSCALESRRKSIALGSSV